MLKRFLFGTAPVSGSAEIILFVLRVFVGLTLALNHGLPKYPVSESFIEGTAAMGFPLPTLFAWLAVISELAGGFGLALGFFTRLSCFGIASTMIVAVFIRHANDGFAKQELGLLYLMIALVFLVIGSGRLGIDRFFR